MKKNKQEAGYIPESKIQYPRQRDHSQKRSERKAA